jgi:hypothetical protein
MTALEITKALKDERSDALLWINEDRKEAAFHGGAVSCAVAVDFNAAMVAKSDPAFGLVDTTDGTTYAAI